MTGNERDVLAELRDLRAQLGGTDDIARESAGLLSELAPTVATLEEQVAVLRGTVTALVADAEDTPAEDPALTAAKDLLGLRDEPPAPWCWPLLDHDQAAAAWEALARWVAEVLAPTYELTRGQLLDCWPRHPRLVAELSALRHGYLTAHARGAAAHHAADWHTRQLPTLLAAVPVVAQPDRSDGCTPGSHRGQGDVEHNAYALAARASEPLTHALWAAAWHEAMAADLVNRRRPAPAPDAA